MPPQTFIFFGRSGSGKGTQARFLIDYLKEKDPARIALYLETGQQIREFSKEEGYTSTLIQSILGKGELLPSFLPIWMWTDFLVKRFTGEEHLIFDGLSRRLHEASVLDSAIRFYGQTRSHVILINVSRDWAFQHLKSRGREDDTDDDINRRLNWYESDVEKALSFFKEKPEYKFIDINGEQTIEKVHQDIVTSLHFQ
ncbi:MAG: nucleoside monophosphate kinase [Candidatus Pacebacteria bacterium]|nr:nucleoside monophosphate kinase [Candidatus Paceibacterota bacterium]